MTRTTVHPTKQPDASDRPDPHGVGQARQQATDWLTDHPMPSRKDESWRYTAVEPILERLAAAAPSHRAIALDPQQIDHMAGDHGGPRLVFINGTFDPGSSRVGVGGGATAAPFSSDIASSPDRAVLDDRRQDGLAALSWSTGDDGASVYVPPGTAVDAPVHIVHIAGPELDMTLATHPNTLVTLGERARLTLIESFVGFTGQALTNSSTIIDVGDRAQLTYHRVQTESPQAIHVGRADIRVGEGARVLATSFSIGATVSRVAFDIAAVGDGSTIEIDGLYLPSGKDQHDNVVTVEHLGSHTRSTQRFKGVIDARARGSFTGHVIVRPAIVDTSATQANHSLLLTRTAEADSRPWLEILADDVSCTHGATVGRLDADALFYLRSRGIPEEQACNVLIDGFISEVVESVEPASLRDHLKARITAKHDRPRAQR
jgi:Fe-S cluster assembly protein SufD